MSKDLALNIRNRLISAEFSLKILFAPLSLLIVWHMGAGKAALINQRTVFATPFYIFFFFALSKAFGFNPLARHPLPKRRDYFIFGLHETAGLILAATYVWLLGAAVTTPYSQILSSFTRSISVDTWTLLLGVQIPLLTLILSNFYSAHWGAFNASLLSALILGFSLSEVSLFPVFFIAIFCSQKIAQKSHAYLAALSLSVFVILLLFVCRVFLWP